MLHLVAIAALLCLASTNGQTCDMNYLRSSLPMNLQGMEITIVTTNDTAPFVTEAPNGIPYGFDADLMNLVSYIYGWTFTWEYVPFAELIPTIQKNMDYISISTQSITTDRLKLVTFAQFFRTGSGFVVSSSFTGKVNTLADLCGLKVVVLAGSTQEIDAQTQAKSCGRKKLTVISVTTEGEFTGALASGSASVGIHDESVITYLVLESQGALKPIGTPYNVAPYGIVCNKKAGDLCCALVNAINSLISDGAYGRLINSYGFIYKDNGVCPSIINLTGPTCDTSCIPSKAVCKKLLA